MNDIPCKDCITLPICKRRVSEDLIKSFTVLYSRCSIISLYCSNSTVIRVDNEEWIKNAYLVYHFLKYGEIYENSM